ncbi:uncharacterized protein LOC119067378 [Bradysia coprophila]|uniref:uncharacterized protein LOC119067378 n=1 Tax=Bradysia coprophila TaxID=38358 RepID=UPI00187DC872|nr:uncharacterized protein LOC119067378 [Bradysia coprophila]
MTLFQNYNISIMHAIQLSLSVTCLIMHFVTEKWGYEYRFDPLFSLTFIGCTVALLAIIALSTMRFAETWDRDHINLHYLSRTEIIFQFIAFVMYSSCGIVNLVYDYRPELLVKGTLSMINGICFLLDVLVCNPCQYRWGQELAADYEQRLSERRAFYNLASYYHVPSYLNQ